MKFQAPIYHGIIYAIFAGVLGISFAGGFSLLVIPFIFLTLAAICYLLAWLSSEDGTIRSTLTFGQGLSGANNTGNDANTAATTAGKDPQTMASMEAGTLNLS